MPIGNGIKINHYFPSKTHPKTETQTIVKENKHSINQDIKPKLNNENTNNIEITENEMTRLEPVSTEQEHGIPSMIKMEPSEGTLKFIPASIALMVKENPETVEAVSNLDSIPVTEEPAASEEEQNSQIVEASPKDKPVPDSEVASSYYRSKIYYVGF